MDPAKSTLLALTATLALLAQVSIQPRPKPGINPSGQVPPRPDLRVDTTLVLIPVAVADPLNRPVNGLEKEDFRLTDDNIPQTITQFAMEDAPAAVGMVFDTSGSMGDALRLTRMAAARFFKTSNPQDEFFLVEFDATPRLMVPLTSDPGKIEDQLMMSKSHGSTALLDAVYLALHEAKKSRKQKKALLVLSDGGDNNSRYTASEVRNLIRESDVLIYAVGAGSDYQGRDLLKTLAEETGGKFFEAAMRELPDIAAKIGIDLRNRYLLGYSPTNPTRDGRYHRVQVKVVPPPGLPPLRPHWRLGYYAPEE